MVDDLPVEWLKSFHDEFHIIFLIYFLPYVCCLKLFHLLLTLFLITLLKFCVNGTKWMFIDQMRNAITSTVNLSYVLYFWHFWFFQVFFYDRKVLYFIYPWIVHKLSVFLVAVSVFKKTISISSVWEFIIKCWVIVIKFVWISFQT